MRLTDDDLRLRTLGRQLPGTTGLLDLFEQLGPVQSQVPRSPFVLASSRLPGTTYAEVNDLFEAGALVKGTCLRGTVHSSTAELWPDLDAVARCTRETALRRSLALERLTVADVLCEVERTCADGWVPRDDVVAAVFAYVEAAEERPVPDTSYVRNLVWGHSGLVRRPRDERWEKRTDAFHRTLYAAAPHLELSDPDEALDRLVLRHVRACGPVTRRDLAYFLGEGLRRIDASLARLDDRLERFDGPAPDPYVDLVDAPPPAEPEAGDVRLLPEFDALLVGYSGPTRARFVRPDQLDQVWGKVNGLYSPTVLLEDRMVATWRLTGAARSPRLEVTMMSGETCLADDALAEPAAALGRVLDLAVTEVEVRPHD